MQPEEYNALAGSMGIAGQAAQANQMNQQQNYTWEEKEKTIAEAQLEVETTLERCYHLLRQDRWKINKDGDFDWIDIDDAKKRTLTDEGVERIIQILRFYINKEGLLSNFDETMINRIMRTFRFALNANFYMKYTGLFREPTLEECRDILKERLKRKEDLKRYTQEILGLKPDQERIKQQVLKEAEKSIEYELEKIRKEKRKENLRDWEMLFEQISQMVFATLNRAWRGEERGSLRRHTNIQEVLGKTVPQSKHEGELSWGRG